MRLASIPIAVTAALFLAGPASAATISVDILSDDILPDDECSLRQAVTAAELNQVASGCEAGEAGAVDVISLDASGTYQLNRPGADEDDNAMGDLDFTTDDAGVVIEGDVGFLGFPTDTIDGGDLDRVLDFQGQMSATLRGVTIQDGRTAAGKDAGGIRASGDASLTIEGNSFITSNVSGESGGGIDKIFPAPLVIRDSVISSNTATGTGNHLVGGGLHSVAPTTIERSVIADNLVTAPGDGSLDTYEGGGIAVENVGAVTSIVDSTISGNSATGFMPDATDVANGGGIWVGGSASLTLRNSTVADNDASAGVASQGAGVYVLGSGANFTSVNSTISGNDAGNAGGGVRTGADTTATIWHTTVSDNDASTGPGITAGAPVTLGRSIVDQGANGCAGPVVPSGGYSVDAGTSCVGAAVDTDLPNTDPLLDPLSLNGASLTQTQRPDETDLHELIPEEQCTEINGVTPLLVDQRGAERPFGPGCEPGSYEYAVCNGQLPSRIGGPGDDTLIGRNVGDVIIGSAGNDTIQGLAAQDLLCGGAGDDVVDGGSETDRMSGGNGNDSLFAKDGLPDLLVDCGQGIDGFSIDAGLDNPILCETDLDAVTPDAPVEPPAGPVPPGTSTNPPAPTKKCKKKKHKRAAVAKKKKCKKKRKR